MRVFVTGASGWVGSDVTRQLIEKGHEVTGLVRSDRSAELVTRLGATPIRGALEDLDVLKQAARDADAVVHCGFVHDFNNFAAAVETDRKAIEAFGEALEGTSKPLVVTGGTSSTASGREATEDDAPDPRVYGDNPRLSEQTALALRDRGLKASVVRLPPSVHGDGDYAFVPALIQVAREKGVSAYIGEGNNLWPAVHRDDAATVFVRAIETGAAYPRYNAVQDTGIPFRQIAEVIGRRLGVPVTSIAAEEATGHFGWLGTFAQFDVAASSTLTRERLGWAPVKPGLLEDLEHGTYFKA